MCLRIERVYAYMHKKLYVCRCVCTTARLQDVCTYIC